MSDFLRWEPEQDARHEYVGGHVYAMTGTSKRHNRVVGALVRVLSPAAAQQGCEVYFIDVKLKIGDLAAFYPDFMICCEREDDHEIWSEAPCLVAEVLSPGTVNRARDEETKLGMYLQIPSLLAYLILDPFTSTVEAHLRSAPGDEWAMSTHDVDDEIALPCPEGATLHLGELFS
jgi:Uma2 family endonuclease